MKVQSLGPFANNTAPDLEHLEVESSKIDQKLKSTAEVAPDAESGDATADQQNRGFVHILDVIQKEEMKKRNAKMRTKELLYSKSGEKHRAALKYVSLDDRAELLDSKGSSLDKAV